MEQQQSIDTKNIKGWGSDADFERRPYYPIHQTQVTGAHWDDPEQQRLTVEVLHSNERPRISRVFGTTAPPYGLSGVIRRFAFLYSENSFGHWMPLILADRINFIEGLVDDVRKGKMPRLFGDGLMIDLKHAPFRFTWRVTKRAVFFAAPFVLLYYFMKKPKTVV